MAFLLGGKKKRISLFLLSRVTTFLEAKRKPLTKYWTKASDHLVLERRKLYRIYQSLGLL